MNGLIKTSPIQRSKFTIDALRSPGDKTTAPPIEQTIQNKDIHSPSIK